MSSNGSLLGGPGTESKCFLVLVQAGRNKEPKLQHKARAAAPCHSLEQLIPSYPYHRGCSPALLQIHGTMWYFANLLR